MTVGPANPLVTGAPAQDRHFQTRHLMDDLHGRSVRGGAVTLSSQAVKFALQIAATAVLARLLTPADFGLIAMVAAVTGFAALFKDLGLSQATVQRDCVTHEQVSAMFWVNVAASGLGALAVVAIAPAIAWFYGEKRLLWVSVALSGTFLFGGLGSQHTALLRRQMRFTALALVELGAMIAGLAAAVALAVAGAGYWALVGQIAVQAAVHAGAAWVASGWCPGPIRRGAGVRPMLRFGGHLTGFNVLNYLTRNLDNVLVGAVLGAGALGIYSRAYNLLMMPMRQLTAPMSAVAVPALSRLQSRPDEFRRYFLKAVGLLAFGGMPIVAFTAAMTPELVPIIMGPGWDEVVPVFRWLAPAAFLGAVNVVPGWLCMALGRPERQLHWAIVSAPVTGLAFAAGLGWGAVGVAAAFSATWCGLFIAFVWYAARGSPVTAGDIAAAVWRPAVAAIASGAACVWVSSRLAEHEPTVRLAACGPVFGASFIVLLAALPDGRRRLLAVLNTLSSLRARTA